jgi:hypothetical protein
VADFYQEAASLVLQSRMVKTPSKEFISRLDELLRKLWAYSAWEQPDVTLQVEIRSFCDWCGLTTDQLEIVRDLLRGSTPADTARRMSWLQNEALEQLEALERVPEQRNLSTEPAY